MTGAKAALSPMAAKAEFWLRHEGEIFSERQRLVLNRLLDGFEGKLISTKYAKKISQDTAARDIADLVARGILTKDAAGGRSTGYVLAG